MATPIFFPASSCETQFSICRSFFSDGSQFDASIPTQSPFGHPKKSFRHQPYHRLRKRKLPHLRVPRDGIHGGDGLPKPIDHQVENRLQSICQRIPGLLQAQRLRLGLWAVFGYARSATGYDAASHGPHGVSGCPRGAAPTSWVIGPLHCRVIVQEFAFVCRGLGYGHHGRRHFCGGQ